MRRSTIVAAIVSAAVASVISVAVGQAVNPLPLAPGRVHVTNNVPHDLAQTDATLLAASGAIGKELLAQNATVGQVSTLTTKVSALTAKVDALTNTLASVQSTVNTTQADTVGLQTSDIYFGTLMRSTAERLYATCALADGGNAPLCYSAWWKENGGPYFRPDDLFTDASPPPPQPPHE